MVIFLNLGYRFVNGISPFSKNHKEISPENKEKMIETLKKLNEKK